jgi:hypothetical protein
MPQEQFADWLRHQGHRVICTSSSFWYEIAPRVYQAFPYHWTIQPSEQELIDLITENGAVALRYSTPLTADMGAASYHVVYSSTRYDIAQLPKKARHDVNHGLEHASIEPLSFDTLAEKGWDLRQDTLQRQRRTKAENRKWWQCLCHGADGLAGFEAWGAIHQDTLVAALLAFTAGDCSSILYQQSLTQHLKYGVNNALIYTFTQHALSQPGVSQVFYGLHSLDAPSSVDEFKFRMNYVARPVRQRLVFHPVVAPLVNTMSHRIVRKLLQWNSGQPTLAKVEGMMRFYLEGKRPLAEQTWPGPLHQCVNMRNFGDNNVQSM